MTPCSNHPVKLTLNSSQERNRLEPLWQPYFLLLGVLGADTEKLPVGAVYWKLISRGGMLLF